MKLVELTEDNGTTVAIVPTHILWVTAHVKLPGHTLVQMEQGIPFSVQGDVSTIIAAINAALA